MRISDWSSYVCSSDLSIAQPIAGQANATGGGNLNLGPEVGKTWTVGVILQPSFVPRLSLSVDYYSIKITGAITSPTPGDAITACFGADQIGRASCRERVCK